MSKFSVINPSKLDDTEKPIFTLDSKKRGFEHVEEDIEETIIPCSSSSSSSVVKQLTPDDFRSLIPKVRYVDTFYILYVGAHGKHISRSEDVESIILSIIPDQYKRVSILKRGVAGFKTRSMAPSTKTRKYDPQKMLLNNGFVATPREMNVAELKLTAGVNDGVGNISLLKVHNSEFVDTKEIYLNDEWVSDNKILFLSDIYSIFNNYLEENDSYGILYLTACETFHKRESLGRICDDVTPRTRSKKNKDQYESCIKPDNIELTGIEKNNISLERTLSITPESTQDAIHSLYPDVIQRGRIAQSNGRAVVEQPIYESESRIREAIDNKLNERVMTALSEMNEVSEPSKKNGGKRHKALHKSQKRKTLRRKTLRRKRHL